jgi:hypothetical protein
LGELTDTVQDPQREPQVSKQAGVKSPHSRIYEQI